MIQKEQSWKAPEQAGTVLALILPQLWQSLDLGNAPDFQTLFSLGQLVTAADIRLSYSFSDRPSIDPYAGGSYWSEHLALQQRSEQGYFHLSLTHHDVAWVGPLLELSLATDLAGHKAHWEALCKQIEAHLDTLLSA